MREYAKNQCVMWGKLSFFIAEETKEELCENHNQINNVIRKEKGLEPVFKRIGGRE